MANEDEQAVAKVSAAMLSITKAADLREDLAMMMQPYTNWEEFFIPAPMTIALLGQLLVVSTGNDFPIDQNMPKDGYKFIRYPKSFRATLVQTSNAGYKAFNKAHTGMDQIRLLSQSIPSTMTKVVKILTHTDTQAVELILPLHLKKIKATADTCLQRAQDVENEFNNVMELTGELLEACTNSKSQYENDLSNIKKELEILKIKNDLVKQEKENSEKVFKQMEKELEGAKKHHKESVDNIPDAYTMLKVSLTEGVINGIKSAISVATFQFITGCGGVQTTSNTQDVSNDIDPMNSGSKYLQNNIFTIGHTMNIFIQKINVPDGLNLQNRERQLNEYTMFEKAFNDISNKLSEADDCPAKKIAMKICSDAANLCSNIIFSEKDQEVNPKHKNKTQKNINSLKKRMENFLRDRKTVHNAPIVTARPPNISKQSTPNQGSMSDMVMQNARMQLQNATEQVKLTQEQHDKVHENLQKTNRELNDILIDMQKRDRKQIDFESSLQMLVKGLKAIALIREQWGKLVRFFQMISNLIDTCLHKELIYFTEECKQVSKLTSHSTRIDFLKDTIYSQVSQAAAVSHLVNMISGAYVDVSNRYLMDNVSSLGKLIALDEKTGELARAEEELSENCRIAQEGIRKLALESKEAHDIKLQKRLSSIHEQLTAVLPLEVEKPAAISGIEESDGDDDDQFA
ncbi:unnamed protein product [Lampetra fluviatilis]